MDKYNKEDFDKFIEKDNDKIEITKGCPNSGSPCFCTGKCKEVIGYINKKDLPPIINKT